MADIDNELIGLLIISWGCLLLSQEHIYKKGESEDNGCVFGWDREIVKEHIIRS